MLKDHGILGLVTYGVVEVKRIVDAVGRSKSLRNFSFHHLFIENEAKAAIEHFLISNCVLNSFTTEPCCWYPGQHYPFNGTIGYINILSPREFIHG